MYEMQVVVLSKKLNNPQSTRSSQDEHYRKDWGHLVTVLQSESVFLNHG